MLLNQLFAADDVRTGFGRQALILGCRNHGYLLGLTQAVRQGHGRANHLVRVARVHTKTQRDVDVFVELRVLDLLQEGDRVGQGVGAGLNSRARLCQILRKLTCHTSFLVSHRSNHWTKRADGFF